MNRDEEHLRLLSIFHYIVAALGALCSFFPLFYTAMGVFFVVLSHRGTVKPNEQPPPEFVGWIFIVFGSVLCLIGLTFGHLYLDNGGDRSRDAGIIGSASSWRALNASSCRLGRFWACLPLSCWHENR